MIAVRRHANGPRLYIADRRVHHFTTGCALALLGIAIAFHDRRDWREWKPVRDQLDKLDSLL